MAQYINPRGQKRKPEDGQGPSGQSVKKLREESGPGPDPNGDLYWVVQWYASAEIITSMWPCIHWCLAGDHLSIRNTKRGTGMVY